MKLLRNDGNEIVNEFDSSREYSDYSFSGYACAIYDWNIPSFNQSLRWLCLTILSTASSD